METSGWRGGVGQPGASGEEGGDSGETKGRCRVNRRLYLRIEGGGEGGLLAGDGRRCERAVEAGSARVEAGGGAAGEGESAPWRPDPLGSRPEEALQRNGRATGAVREGDGTAGRRGVEASAAWSDGRNGMRR